MGFEATSSQRHLKGSSVAGAGPARAQGRHPWSSLFASFSGYPSSPRNGTSTLALVLVGGSLTMSSVSLTQVPFFWVTSLMPVPCKVPWCLEWANWLLLTTEDPI